MSLKSFKKIRIIRGLINLKSYQDQHPEPSVVTIGAFDGLHLGHQRVIEQLDNYPGKKIIILFEPVLPKEFFSNNKIPRISRLRDKLIFLDQLEIDAVLLIKFDQKFSELAPQDFIKNILITGLNTRVLIIGDDFKFGFKRAGDFNLLKSQAYFKTYPTETLFKLDPLENPKRVASSWVRELIMAGDFPGVKNLLGRAYCLTGKVGHGDKKGRVLGFPTMNIFLKNPMAVSGVYLVKVSGVNDQIFYGLANVGTRPTLTQGLKRLLEVYLILDLVSPLAGETGLKAEPKAREGAQFNTALNAYGLNISVEFVQKIRDEQKFGSLEGLRAQIEKDLTHAKLLVKMPSYLISN